MKRLFKKITAFTLSVALTATFMPKLPSTLFEVNAADYDWGDILKEDDSYFASSEGIALADTILTYQLDDGGWRKAMDDTSQTGSWAKSTIDNETTTSQIRVLARVYEQTGTEKYKTGCVDGIELLINGQYDNGGWPQVFDDAGTYHAHITYNDNAMINVMNLLTEVRDKNGDFTFVDSSLSTSAGTAVDKGIECILDTQIIINGEYTGWCQQHDEYTLKPASGRAYELESISSSESVKIVNYLKTIDNPSTEITNHINYAVKWMTNAQLNGIKIESYTNSDGESDKRVVADASADPIWARFYYLTDGTTPMFVSRESVAADNWDHIGAERRTGYSWYGTWPKSLVAAGYTEPEVTVPDVPVSGNHLYVGYDNISGSFDTVQAAVDRAAELNPQSESDRVTIHIAPGTYREQIVVNTPYISFVNDTPSQQVLLTWYYGIGYMYYSVGEDGYYDAERAAAKTQKTDMNQRWGSATALRGGADYFRAEHITFENSFNRYVTAEEIADGVEPSGAQSITFERTSTDLDVQSKTATERAAAIAIDGDYCEFYQCEFYGSQDTLFTGGSHGYFKECFIEGNTDYIFGTGNFVFQDCDLSFKGYSSSASGGYITANKGNGGYLFTDCDVIANSALTVNAGYFGRPWAADANVAFVNTRLQYESIITPVGWYKMSGNTPENANFKEYNTTANGNGVDTSSRTSGTVLSSASGLAPTDYFGTWVPYYYTYTGTPVEPVVLNGNLIKSLTISDTENSANWSIDDGIAIGELVFGDRDVTYITLPESLVGAEYIRTACDSKSVTTNLGTFTANGDIDVYIAIDNRVTTLPAWLSGWTNTGMTAENSKNVSFNFYKQTFTSGSTVTLGQNGQSSGCVGYTVFVTEAGTDIVAGDVNADGILSVADLVVLQKWLLDVPDVTLADWQAADLCNDGQLNVFDLCIMKKLLIGK